MWDEVNEEFIHGPEQILQLEHSLDSLSKWESKWNKIFLTKEKKTSEETLDYIKCMTITPNVDPGVYQRLTPDNTREITEYISAPMSATYFPDTNGGPSREQASSELIYYWMITLNIPFECQSWHLNRLLALIRVCNIKNQPAKKMGAKELRSRNRELNEARRKQLNTKG